MGEGGAEERRVLTGRRWAAFFWATPGCCGGGSGDWRGGATRGWGARGGRAGRAGLGERDGCAAGEEIFGGGIWRRR